MPVVSEEVAQKFAQNAVARQRRPRRNPPVVPKTPDRIAEYRVRFGIEGVLDRQAESMIRYKAALDKACRTLKTKPYKPEAVAKVCGEFGVDPFNPQYQSLVQAIVEGEAYLRMCEQIRNPKPEERK